ncbi:hypothetical protein [Wolbachia endosymbiont (group A) of Sphaerophoria taeniata]|uniref:hypothetical protein n=1 Tax=Wolbachia endosymbiont (group A) of Sphaerophoria taeniata TaxID=2954057 RepID=UPI002225FA9E|nr:hypothetical protein [Wolbachia endosymbiont (group A) of Sphaerophoria taeniata]
MSNVNKDIVTDNFGNAPLHWSALNGEKDVVKPYWVKGQMLMYKMIKERLLYIWLLKRAIKM